MVSGPGGFAGDVVAALAADFAAHGAEAIAALRERNPNAYLRLCASALRTRSGHPRIQVNAVRPRDVAGRDTPGLDPGGRP